MFDQMFGNMGSVDSVGFQEREAATKGHCPSSRICTDREDIAAWLKSFAISAGATKRSTAETE